MECRAWVISDHFRIDLNFVVWPSWLPSAKLAVIYSIGLGWLLSNWDNILDDIHLELEAVTTVELREPTSPNLVLGMQVRTRLSIPNELK